MYVSCFVTQDGVSLNFAVTRPRHAVQQILYTHHLSICLSIQLPNHLSIQVTDSSRYVCMSCFVTQDGVSLNFHRYTSTSHQ